MDRDRGDRASRIGLRLIYVALLVLIALTNFASYRATKRGNTIGEGIQSSIDSTREERKEAVDRMERIEARMAASDSAARADARAAKHHLDDLYRRMSWQVSNVGRVADTLKAAMPERKKPRR